MVVNERQDDWDLHLPCPCSPKEGGGQTSIRLGVVSAPALASPRGPSPPSFLALHRASPPQSENSTLDKAQPRALGTGAPMTGPRTRHLARSRPASAGERQADDTLACERRRRNHKHMEQAKIAAREASMVSERAHQAIAH